jgi:pseudolysin/vibriolysin
VSNISGATGAYVKYTMVVPAGATGLKFVMSGGTGDADMYVKFGSEPTDSSYDCRPYVNGNAETCNIATAQAGTYYINLKGYAAFSGVSLTGSYTTGGTGGGCTPSGTVLCSGTTVALPSVAKGGVSSNYTLVVPAGSTSLVVSISGGTGDADLYVKLGSAPTTSSYTCRPYLTGNNETCTLNAPTAGTYYINVRAYAAYSGVSLKGTVSP